MDIQLHFTQTGVGEPLILLHGNGESGAYFEHQIRYFSRWYRVIALDTRGQGSSPRGEEPFTIRQFARDLYDFMELQGIEKAHLLGFSDGANVALCFALEHPERVDRLILNGANLDAGGVKRSVQRPIELGYRCASLFAKLSAKARQNAELLGLMVNEPRLRPEELTGVRAKTLVICGTKDLIKAEHTRLIHAHIPDAELVWIEGDHFIAGKKPEPFNRAVQHFLRGRACGEE